MSDPQQVVFPPEDEPGLRGLWLGILAYRWVSFAWMSVEAFAWREDFRYPWLALTAIGVTGAWVAFLTLTRGWERRIWRLVDLGEATVLVVLSGLVVAEGQVVGSDIPFFATAYPVTAAMTVGAADGVGAGLLAGLGLSIALALSRVVNGTPLSELTTSQWLSLLNGAVYYLIAGGAVGLISRVLRRSAAELREANEEAAQQRERAARLAEHQALGREIHDSVLQALAMVNKRGAELADRPSVPGSDVRALVETAGEQAHALRELIQREVRDAPPNTVSLRTVLQAAAYGVTEVPVTLSTEGEIWLPAQSVDGLSSAIRQALENVVQHANASGVWILAEEDQAGIIVTIRDNGIGFEYDEGLLRREGKMGLLASMKERIEELGGTLRIESARGKGTEVELRVPGGA